MSEPDTEELAAKERPTFSIRVGMFEPLLNACPSFRPTWQDFIDDWQDEPGDLPTYLALADLARHLIGMMAAGKTDEFPAIFHVVEQWHLDPDHYVREAASIGLLEAIQNTNLHEAGTSPDQFISWLQPESLLWWKKVEAFWEEGIPLNED